MSKVVKDIKKNVTVIRRCATILTLMLLIFTLCGCGSSKRRIKLDDTAAFNDREVTIGVAEGYIFGEVAGRTLPEANIKYFSTRENLYKALRSGNIDGIVDDEPIIKAVRRSYGELKIIDGYLEPAEYAFAFPKNPDGESLCTEFSSYIKEIRNSGELSRLDAKWFGNETDNKVSEDISELSGENGVIRLAFDDSNIPFAYMSAGRPVGYDIDIAIGFCRKYGYRLEISKMDFAGMLEAVENGECEVGCGAITVTQSRKDKMYFSIPSYQGGVSICTLSDEKVIVKNGFFGKIKTSFKKAFVDGGRYKVFLKGTGMSLLITLAAVILGTPFGVIMYMLSRKGNLYVRMLSKALMWIIQGIPAVMMILLLYFAFYEGASSGGLVASIVGLLLFFASSVYRNIGKNASCLEDGKLEEEYRLEYITGREFYKKLRERSGRAIADEYRESVVMLLNLSTVAGYVSVQELTGAFVNIKNSSGEVALPLLMTLLVYFVIIKLIGKLLKI